MLWVDWSLRRKLVAACVLVQLAATALLILGSTRDLQRTLIAQTRLEVQQVVALLDQAIAAPLAQRDYATLQQTLDLIRGDDRSDGAITYLVLWDHRDRMVAMSGWQEGSPLPPRDTGDIDLDRADTNLHLAVPVTISGQTLGHLDLGLSTSRLRQARADHLRRSLVVGALALLTSVLVLAAIALAITRHLARLAYASQRVAEGQFDVQVPVTTGDEIGRLGASFNAMAIALKDRVAALQKSEAQQKLHLAEARDEQARLTTLLGAMQRGILFVDERAQVIYANAAFSRMWSLPQIAPGHGLETLLPMLAGRVEASDVIHLESILPSSDSLQSVKCELHTLDGRIIVQRMQPVARGTEGGGSIWFHDDVTEERRTQQRAHQAVHDPLTSLFNRRGLYEALNAAIAHATARGEALALLFIDLDDFKQANDAGGHRFGDEILISVARTLAAQLRKGELVARLGGDEFAVLCPGLAAADAGAIAARIVDAVSGLAFSTPTQSLRVGCSVGVATCPADASTEDDLIACADAAMYDAKRSGKNGWAAYRNDPLHSQAESARVNWNTRIHRALQDKRFVLHFQPVHHGSDLRVSHHEALVRMVDEGNPDVLIPPTEFIPYAERSGKIRQIDRWVFEACVTRLASEPPDVRIAANLSARSLEDSSFPGFLQRLFLRLDVDPRRLHIELTETSAITDPVAARRLIGTLGSLGCAVHLDDFGSGFSSFAHLKLLGADAIKIDGVYIRNLLSDSSNRLFVASTIEIAHNLGKLVIAEHVEDAATLDTLRGFDIDLVQGFYLARPSARLSDMRRPAVLEVVPGARKRPGEAA